MKKRYLALAAALAVLLVCGMQGNGLLPLAQGRCEEGAADGQFAVGGYVTFGACSQTESGTDDTPIEWLVLDRDGEKALLISRYALDSQVYDVSGRDATWENCTLRGLLNGAFVNRAFSAAEQACILTTNVDNSGSQSCLGLDGGNSTQDKVFLLSYAEAWKYFGSDADRVCQVTDYAVGQGAYRSGDGNGCWLLRSTGWSESSVSAVGEKGTLENSGTRTFGNAVRPALWIDVGKYSETREPLPGKEQSGERTAELAVGSYVTFGAYPQTESGTDSTPIEWLVLDVDGQKALLISRYALDSRKYNDAYEKVTWQTCTLRTWLNGAFLQQAFSAEEQNGILWTHVDNSVGQGFYDTAGGKDTQDKIFLLSYAEAWKYFESDAARMCQPTAYAVREDAYAGVYCMWRLRSPGSKRTYACEVYENGTCGMEDVFYGYDTVRPALWIDLGSGVL